MKKFYNKPRVAVERFESSSSVAVGCSTIIAEAAPTCAVILELLGSGTGCEMVDLGGRYVQGYYASILACDGIATCNESAENTGYAGS